MPLNNYFFFFFRIPPNARLLIWIHVLHCAKASEAEIMLSVPSMERNSSFSFLETLNAAILSKRTGDALSLKNDYKGASQR